MGQGRHTLRSISDPVYSRVVWTCKQLSNHSSMNIITRNSSGDEIANVNFLYTTTLYTHYKIQ